MPTDGLPNAEARNLRLIGHTDMNGCGDGMQIMKNGSTLYVGHMGKTGTSVLDISDPRQPEEMHSQFFADLKPAELLR